MMKSTFLLLAAAVGGLIYTVSPSLPGDDHSQPTASRPVMQPPVVRRSDAEIREAAVQRAKRSLDWARSESERARREQLDRVRRFILSSKKGTRRFADVALSFRSKCKRLVDYLPLTDGNRSRRFLAQQFRELVIDVRDLKTVIVSSTREYVRSLKAIEDDMLVRIEMDIADLPRTALPGLADGRSLSVAFDRTLESTVMHVGDGVQREVATMVASDVVALITARLMVSSAVLGSGAAASGATLGVSLAAAIVADLVISWAWNKITDPQGKLTRELNRRIDLVVVQVLEGHKGRPGLNASFAELSRGRDRLRRRVLCRVLRGQKEESR